MSGFFFDLDFFAPLARREALIKFDCEFIIQSNYSHESVV